MSPTPAGPDSSDRILVVEDDAAQRVGLQQLLRELGLHRRRRHATAGTRWRRSRTCARRSCCRTSSCRRWAAWSCCARSSSSTDPDVTVVLMTAQGTVETAVEAIKQGAYDYVSKPVDPQRLKILLDQIVERHGTLREVRVLRRQLHERGTFGKMIGGSVEMRKIYQVIEQAAPTSASVLVSGESGTGKELVAQTIHQLSPRASQPFVAAQLRGDSGHAARVRAVRPREGRVHRRDRAPRRAASSWPTAARSSSTRSPR